MIFQIIQLLFLFLERMYESKMKELETDIDKKNKSLSDLKQLLREATEREQKTEHCISDLKEQVSFTVFLGGKFKVGL